MLRSANLHQCQDVRSADLHQCQDVNRKMIRNANPDSQINPDVRCISPKMLWIHYLAGISHFAKFHKNRAVTVWEMLINLLKFPFCNGEENEKLIRNTYLGLEHQQKLNQFFRLVAPSIKLVHYFFSNPAHRMRHRQTDRQTQRSHNLRLVGRGN